MFNTLTVELEIDIKPQIDIYYLTNTQMVNFPIHFSDLLWVYSVYLKHKYYKTDSHQDREEQKWGGGSSQISITFKWPCVWTTELSAADYKQRMLSACCLCVCMLSNLCLIWTRGDNYARPCNWGTKGGSWERKGVEKYGGVEGNICFSLGDRACCYGAAPSIGGSLVQSLNSKDCFIIEKFFLTE